MLATAIDEPFDDENWLFEIKWDGFRALAFINEGKVALKSRSDQNLNHKFPSIVRQLARIDEQVIFDGELVILDKKGKSHFQWMQNYQKESKGTLCYYIFDLLFKDGIDMRELPLIERKEELRKYLKVLNIPLLIYSDHVHQKGKAFFTAAQKNGLEGIIGKKMNSPYQSRRSKDWVKIKTEMRQEVVIGGFTAPRGARKNFGALMVGFYDRQGHLIYCGHTGGGFDEKNLAALHKQLLPLVQKKSPFKVIPKPNAPVQWVKPKLICEVSFSEWTEENIMRHPIFKGMRSDKSAQEIHKEKAMPAKKLKSPCPAKSDNSTKSGDLQLTHLEKIYWPKEKYTKGDLIAYYEKIAPYILPYLKDRPIMLHRYPDGIEGLDFYQKDLGAHAPSWVKSCEIQHGEKTDRYLMITDVKSLLYAVNLGSIDIHPLISKCGHLDTADFCVIDLDPHEIPFSVVVEAAQRIHELLENIKIKHYCKTSGGKGLHILIPLNRAYSYEQSRQFAEIICHIIHAKMPKTTSMERSPQKRPKRLYLDCLQNRTGQTIVAPYSARPRPLAKVSTPLEWNEVNGSLDVNKFTILTVPKRLEKKGDLLAKALKEKNDLQKALKLLSTR